MKIKLVALLALGVVAMGDAQAAGPTTQVLVQGAVYGQLAGQTRADRRADRRGDRRGDRRRDDRKDDRWDDRKGDRWDDRFDRREDRRDDRRDERWERYWRYRIGLRLLTLPARHTRVVIGPSVYYYSDGVYLEKVGTAYVVVRSPLGARVRVLPYGFRSVYIGPRRYFYVNATYYVYAPDTREYVVVEAPQGADTATETPALDPIVYPANDQSQEQIDLDRQECHQWALEQSEFDPTSSQSASAEQDNRYERALSACLTGRGYTVE